MSSYGWCKAVVETFYSKECVKDFTVSDMTMELKSFMVPKNYLSDIF
jgi:hypothetical protein